jgi:hypothetical protein
MICGCEVVTAVAVKTAVFREVKLCSLRRVYQVICSDEGNDKFL